METKYFAFISYSSKDNEWGKKLQKKLENYRMPATLCREKGWNRTPMRPVFFAPTDIQPGLLSEELKSRLRNSKNLIVICSPNSAQSKWVGEEIAYFHSLGRVNDIHFFIVDGSPNSGDQRTECFNPIVSELKIPEILGVNINEKVFRYPWLNRERTYVQLISKLLGVEFDSVWGRHRKLLLRKITWMVSAIVLFICGVLGAWSMSQPIDVAVRLDEAFVHNGNLPPMHDAIVSIILENEVKSDTLASFDDDLIFANIPRRFHGKPVKLSVQCRDFKNLDTVVVLNQSLSVNIHRDPSVYGYVNFVLWNENLERCLPNTKVIVGGHIAESDDNGRVSLTIPLEEQQVKYKVECSYPLQSDTIYMPCSKSSVILIGHDGL